MQYQVSFAGCPQWLLSAILSTDSNFLACSDQSTTTVDAKPRNAFLARTIAPQRTRSLATPPTFYGGRQSLQRPFFVRPTAMPALIRRSPRLDKHCAAGGSRPTSRVRVTPRVAVPLPFPDACIANRIDFHSRGCRGISLDEWAKLAEKGKTSLGIDDPLEGLDELFSGEEQLLFQSHWPGYDPRTCYINLPAHVTAGEAAFTKVDVLDMVCQALVDWVLKLINCRQIECREPEWAIGLKQITFRHIYVTSVVEVKGYVSKWVPVLEIDPRAFQPLCQL